jgi:16S rRNA (adenine1518-N6/adenine1519-N6)-dimethyltransferase
MNLPRAKKDYSQNWLVDESVVKKIIEAAQIAKGEAVLEIGPGTGLLTTALVDAGAHVTAVEADKDLIEPLRAKFGDEIELVYGDALDEKFSMSGAYKLIANLPYSITSDILKHYLTHRNPPTRMVLMLQKEVVERMIAKPGAMSVLSVVCQIYAECKRVSNVPRGAFRPMPKVESAVVQLDLKDVSDAEFDPEQVISLAKQGFSSRRKQLHKNLSGLPNIASDFVKDVLEELGLDPRLRAQEMRVDDWIRLTHKITQKLAENS